MLLELERFAKGNSTTAGRLFIDNTFVCYTLEDSVRAEKIMHKTAIWQGFYELELHRVKTPMTERYRQRFDWFHWHLKLKDVPEFENVYIHIGNKHTDSSGCVLVGESVIYENNEYHLTKSVTAYHSLYKKLFPVLDIGERVVFEVAHKF